MAQALEQILGIVLGLLVLVDIFLLVLYARADTGLIGKYLSHAAWRGLVWMSKPMGQWRAQFLALTGPLILVLMLFTWALLLSLATALIIHPNLGTGIQATQGSTATDFLTALYVGGSSLSFIGASEFVPKTSIFRLFFLLTSLIGVSSVTLIVTYLMELYSGLRERNATGLKVRLLSLETGDAAEIIARLGPQGKFDSGYSILADWAAEISHIREAHHFYPMMFYFRFREPFYSVSYTTLASLDTVSLIKSALDDQEYQWLKESAAVEQLWHGTLMELKTLSRNFVSKEMHETPPGESTRALWRRRYEAGVARIRQAGIKTKESGAEQYIALRAQWDPYISLLAPRFAYDLDEIDPAVARVKQAGQDQAGQAS